MLDIRFIGIDDWRDFEEQFPAAMAFLRARSIRHEHQYLTNNEYILNQWQKDRLTELNKIFGAKAET